MTKRVHRIAGSKVNKHKLAELRKSNANLLEVDIDLTKPPKTFMILKVDDRYHIYADSEEEADRLALLFED